MYLVGITLFGPNPGLDCAALLPRREGRTVHPLSVISHCDITDCEVSVAVQRGANSPSANSRNTENTPADTEKMNGTFTFSSPRPFDHAIAMWTAPIDASVGAAPRSNADFPHSNVNGAGRPSDAHNGRVRSRRAPPGR